MKGTWWGGSLLGKQVRDKPRPLKTKPYLNPVSLPQNSLFIHTTSLPQSSFKISDHKTPYNGFLQILE